MHFVLVTYVTVGAIQASMPVKLGQTGKDVWIPTKHCQLAKPPPSMHNIKGEVG